VKSYTTSLHQTIYSNNILVRVNEDSRAVYYALLRFCVMTPEACSSPDGPRPAVGGN